MSMVSKEYLRRKEKDVTMYLYTILIIIVLISGILLLGVGVYINHRDKTLNPQLKISVPQ